jgi:hypothetical protein
MRRLAWITARDAAAVALLSVVLAIGFNAARPSGSIPLIAREPYTILVPCPEPVGEVETITAAEVRWGHERELVLDARLAHERETWSTDQAQHLPFDFLEPVSDEALAELVRSNAARVVVFGDGLTPDSGEELAKELAGRGMVNVHFVEGGWEAARDALEPEHGEVTP